MRLSKKILADKINELLENTQLKDWIVDYNDIETYRNLSQNNIECGASLMYIPLKRKDGKQFNPILINAPYNIKGYQKELSKPNSRLVFHSSKYGNELTLYVE